MRVLKLLIVIFLNFRSGNGQTVSSDAVFRVINATFTINGVRRVAATSSILFSSEESAISQTLDPSLLTVPSACEYPSLPCDVDATCYNVNPDEGLIRCECNAGFRQDETFLPTFPGRRDINPDGTSCQDIDECSMANICGSSGSNECINIPGSYSCLCHLGYNLTSTNVCEDIDECAYPFLNTCLEQSNCRNTEGSFTCLCNEGFTGDGFTCLDVNECMGEPCGIHGKCTNTEGDYICACGVGYLGDGISCEDVDECSLTEESVCHDDAVCFNTEGSFACECLEGFVGDGFACLDTNECLGPSDNACSDDATCTNTDGSYICECNDGFFGDGITCSAGDFSYCYRLSLNVNGMMNSSANDSLTEEAENATLTILDSIRKNDDFSFTATVNTEKVIELGNETLYVQQVCFEHASKTADDFTKLLTAFRTTITLHDYFVTISEFDECRYEYAQCVAPFVCVNTKGNYKCSATETSSRTNDLVQRILLLFNSPVDGKPNVINIRVNTKHRFRIFHEDIHQYEDLFK